MSALTLYHVHLPDGSVSAPLPAGQIRAMIEAGDITLDSQLCRRGEQTWTLARYVLPDERTPRRDFAACPPSLPGAYSTEVAAAPVPVGEGLVKAAKIFAGLGVALFLLGWMIAGPLAAGYGGGGALALALVLGVVGGCLKG
jgi:hypothetical protein